MKFYVVLVIISIFLISCKTKDKLIATRNLSRYSIKYLGASGKMGDSILIYGYVKDLNTNEGLSHSTVTFSCLKKITDETGYYHFSIIRTSLKTQNTTDFLKVSSIGTYGLETNFLSFKNRNSININFYLAPDDRMMINCDGFE